MMRLGDRPDPSSCQQCGSHVTPDFRRTFGDGDDVAHRCLECDSYGRVQLGSAAGLEVDRVDPIDEPWRQLGAESADPARTDGGGR